MPTNIDSNRLRQFFFIVIIIALGGVIAWKVFPFITALLGALTFYALFRNLMFYLSVKKNWKRGLAALFIMVLTFVIILFPTGFMLKLLYNKLEILLATQDVWLPQIQQFILTLNDRLGVDILSQKNLDKLPGLISNILPNVLLATVDAMLLVVLLYFVLYFMLTEGRDMERLLYKTIPIKNANLQKIEHEIIAMVVSNAIGIPLLAVLQAVFAFAAYWFLGVPDPMLWGAVTAFASMIPVIGSTIVWFPLSLYLYFTGLEWQGITLWVFGAVVIINVDNVFRLILQKRMADVHPLVTMFGVIIGLSLFGFIGLIFGPLLLSIFIVLIKVYKDEFLQKDPELETPTD